MLIEDKILCKMPPSRVQFVKYMPVSGAAIRTETTLLFKKQ